MRRVYRFLVYLEVLVCFGPLGGVLLLGLLALPIWTQGLWAYIEDDGERLLWDSLWPILVVFSGIVGFWGLVRVLAVAVRTNAKPRSNRVTILMVGIGIFGLVLFNVVAGPLPLLREEGLGVLVEPASLWASLIYVVLPVSCASHLVYLARRQ